jgi:predicted DNA-binding protein
MSGADAFSLKLPKPLKARIARLAKRAGERPQAYIPRLLEAQVEAAQRFEAFVTEACRADERVRETCSGYFAREVHECLRARVAGRRKPRPKPVLWRK